MNLIEGQISKLLAFDIIMGGHSKNMFNVDRGLKIRLKMDKGRGFKPIFTLVLWKIAWFFNQQTEFFLISCLVVAKSLSKSDGDDDDVVYKSLAYKGGFLLKRRRLFFFHLTFFYDHDFSNSKQSSLAVTKSLSVLSLV